MPPKRFPPLPKTVNAPGGPITVKRAKKIVSGGVECWGLWEDHTRTITIDTTAPASHQWKVLYHEIAHAWLNDSGLENGLSHELVEALCDCIGAARYRERFG